MIVPANGTSTNPLTPVVITLPPPSITIPTAPIRAGSRAVAIVPVVMTLAASAVIASLPPVSCVA